jgi:hypothetical protein
MPGIFSWNFKIKISASPFFSQDLLKQALDNKDSPYLKEAIDLLHEELIRLNSSIKSCELACSVARIRNNGRKSGSIRRLSTRGRLAGKQLAKQLMK